MVLVIDPQNAGIAGNMIAGAFIDLGIDPNEMKEIMESVAVDFGGVKVHINKINKAGIESTYLEVETIDGSDVNCVNFNDSANLDKNLIDENFKVKNNNLDVDSKAENNNNNSSIPYGKFLDKLKKINKNNDLIDDEIFRISKNVFDRIAISEAKIHGKSLEKVHFHEVGAADAIADVFGSVFAYCRLGFNNSKEKVIGLPIALGGGSTKGAHGRIPIPSPAVMNMLNEKDITCFGGPIATELATPTGVALYLELCDEYKDFQPMMKPINTSYGAGKKDLDFPNVLRLIYGSTNVKTQTIEVIETNIDHLSGEMMGYLFEKLMDLGANDVAIIPIIMKKNRPGHLLKVISRKKNSEKLLSAIFKETGTLGIRISEHVHRGIASRKIIAIDIDIGGKKEKIKFKIGLIGDEIISSRPEYEDIRKIAKKSNISLNKVQEIANQGIKKYLDEFGVN